MTSTDPRSECREARSLSSAILDLDQEMLDVIAAHRHIGECPSCKKFIDELRTVSDLVRLSPHDEVAEDLARRIRARAAIPTERARPLDPARLANSSAARSQRASALSRSRIAVAAAVLLAGFCGVVAGRMSNARDFAANSTVAERSATDATGPIARGEPTQRTIAPANALEKKSPAHTSLDKDSGVARAAKVQPTGRVEDVLLIADDFLRYAHPLIEDIGRIEEIDQPLRRPLVLAEINYADLPRRAERILAPDAAPHVGEDVREVARFVMDLSGRIRSAEYAPGSVDAAGAKRLLVMRKEDPRVRGQRIRFVVPSGEATFSSVSSSATSGSTQGSASISIMSTSGTTNGAIHMVEGMPADATGIRLIEFFENFRRRTLPAQGFQIFVPDVPPNASSPTSEPVRPGDI